MDHKPTMTLVLTLQFASQGLQRIPRPSQSHVPQRIPRLYGPRPSTNSNIFDFNYIRSSSWCFFSSETPSPHPTLSSLRHVGVKLSAGSPCYLGAMTLRLDAQSLSVKPVHNGLARSRRKITVRSSLPFWATEPVFFFILNGKYHLLKVHHKN